MGEIAYELEWGCAYDYWQPVISPEEALDYYTYNYDLRQIARCEIKNYGKWKRAAMAFKEDEHVG